MWIRYSNATPRVQSDKVPDARGMAIKIIGDFGPKILPAQEASNAIDFNLVSGPVFPVADLKEYQRPLTDDTRVVAAKRAALDAHPLYVEAKARLDAGSTRCSHSIVACAPPRILRCDVPTRRCVAAGT